MNGTIKRPSGTGRACFCLAPFTVTLALTLIIGGPLYGPLETMATGVQEKLGRKKDRLEHDPLQHVPPEFRIRVDAARRDKESRRHVEPFEKRCGGVEIIAV